MRQTVYDEVAYGSMALRHASPNLLAGIAQLVGAHAPSPDGARVLELGCGDGSNLIPMAFYWPRSVFLGVDLASTPVAEGQAQIARLGLRNARLRVGDIAALEPADLGTFDFVIAHGVFSWIPEPVREALLRLMSAVLAPEGIGYVSYNALPGCHVRHLVRDLLQFALREAPYTPQVIEPAWKFLEPIGELEPSTEHNFFNMLRAEAVGVLEGTPEYLFHDDLSPTNRPYYLHEFAAMAGRHGLAVVADAEPDRIREPDGPPGLTRWIDAASGGDWVARMQYVDFVRGTRFKRTLLAHARALPALGWRAEAIAQGRWFTDPSPEAAARVDDLSEATISGMSRVGVEAGHSTIKAALAQVHQSPGSFTTGEFAQAIGPALPSGADAMRTAGDVLMGLMRSGIVLPIALPWPGAGEPFAFGNAPPRISALTRDLLERNRPLVDAAQHSLMMADDWADQLLLRMDGSRDIDALCVLACELTQPDGEPQTPATREAGRPRLDGLLDMLASRGLLAAPAAADAQAQP